MKQHLKKKAHISFSTILRGIKEWDFRSLLLGTEYQNSTKENDQVNPAANRGFIQDYESYYDYEILWI